MKNNLLRLLALATALLAANSARASIVTYQFTGTVTTYSPTTPGLPASILGDTATGTFSYNNAAPGGPFYHNASDLQLSMTVTINNTYTFSLTTLGTNGDEIDLDQFIGISFGYYKRGPDELVTGAPTDSGGTGIGGGYDCVLTARQGHSRLSSMALSKRRPCDRPNHLPTARSPRDRPAHPESRTHARRSARRALDSPFHWPSGW